jgi:hypothetical protein
MARTKKTTVLVMAHDTFGNIHNVRTLVAFGRHAGTESFALMLLDKKKPTLGAIQWL